MLAAGQQTQARLVYFVERFFRHGLELLLGSLLAFALLLARLRGGEQLFAQFALDLLRDRRVFLEEVADVVLTLTDAITVVGVPGACLVDETLLDAELDQLAFARGALAVKDLELGLLEGRGHLVLDDLDAGLAADNLVALLDTADTANIQTHRAVELERVIAGGGFRAAEHHADLHTDLVNEDHQRVGALDIGGELTQRLAHQTGVQADVGVAHFAFDFGLRR